MRIAFQFASIELAPYPAFGEFVIVGIVAVSSDARFTYRLLSPQQIDRLTHFFPEIDQSIFVETLLSLRVEMDRLANQVNGASNETQSSKKQDDDMRFFRALVSPREGMVRFTARGTAISDSIDQWIATAFDRYVLRVRQDMEVGDTAL